MKELFYRVAGHVFSLHIDGHEDVVFGLRAYEPFAVEPTEQVLFTVQLTDGQPDLTHFAPEQTQEEEGREILSGRVGTQSCFIFNVAGRRRAVLTASADYRRAVLYADGDNQYSVNNAMMVMYALATANLQTALFHAAVVSHRGRGYLFLGKSGTGKSTHASLWLRYISGTELVNDDNPVVRLVDGEARVYGSPWSGKTPCYRNISMPVGAFVNLRQAPANAIRRLRPIEGYAALVSSISGKRWDGRLAEGLHETEERLARTVPTWQLDCLPDEAAARLCCESVSKK